MFDLKNMDRSDQEKPPVYLVIPATKKLCKEEYIKFELKTNLTIYISTPKNELKVHLAKKGTTEKVPKLCQELYKFIMGNNAMKVGAKYGTMHELI